jgi:hypothetical protein
MEHNKWSFVAGSGYAIPDSTTFHVHETFMRMEAIVPAGRQDDNYQNKRDPLRHVILLVAGPSQTMACRHAICGIVCRNHRSDTLEQPRKL